MSVTLNIVCKECSGTGLYVGMGERDGVAVVCRRCDGTGKTTFTYEPFSERRPAPPDVQSVHVARGYFLNGQHALCDGGLPIEQWQPGATVPADEQLYCPYVYTQQEWCAKPEMPSYGGRPQPPILVGMSISNCKHWSDKVDCWRLFYAEAPEKVRGQVS